MKSKFRSRLIGAMMALVDRALALNMGAQESLEAALAADPHFAMVHIALAREFQYRGQNAAAQASTSDYRSNYSASHSVWSPALSMAAFSILDSFLD